MIIIKRNPNVKLMEEDSYNNLICYLLQKMKAKV